MKALAETSPDPGHYNGRGPDLPGTPQRINNISPENWANKRTTFHQPTTGTVTYP